MPLSGSTAGLSAPSAVFDSAELGHWCHHRGRMLFCRADDIGSRNPGTPQIERVADVYAADLLLPCYLFVPISRQHAKLGFRVVRELADLLTPA